MTKNSSNLPQQSLRQSAIKLALSHQQQGNFQQAEQLYLQILQISPDNIKANYLLGTLYLQMKRYAPAQTYLQKSLQLKPDNPDGHCHLGSVLLALGQPKRAIDSFRQALHLLPDSAIARTLGDTLRALGQASEAVNCYRLFLKHHPGHAIVHNNLGAALNDLKRFDEALDSYQAALSQQPDYATAHKNIAALYEQMNKLDLAEQHIRQAMTLDPDNPSISYTRAVLLKRRNETDEAIRILVSLDQDPRAGKQLGERKMQLVQFELGRLYDQQGDCDRAMAHFTRGNRLAEQVAGLHEHRPDKQVFLRQLDALERSILSDFPGNRADSTIAGEQGTPVFLLGFPRSGTTLLDQILDSHPQLQVMEEKPALLAVSQAINHYYRRYPEALLSLQPSELARLREIYWHKTAQYLDPTPHLTLVDKNPLSTPHIPLLNTVFPGCRILFAMRHPCDVVLSCFMQNFRMNNAMANFSTLADSVHLYARVMGLWLRYRDQLPINYHVIRYEDLVSDFQPTLKALVDFLPVDWDDALLNYRQTAQDKHIHTPSYQTVTQPIYTHARYRWQRYERHLQPFLKTLQPYIEKFGYS